MSEPRVRKRKPVRHKQLRDVERQLTDTMGLEVDMSSSFIELAHFDGNDILILDRKIVAVNMELPDSRQWVIPSPIWRRRRVSPRQHSNY